MCAPSASPAPSILPRSSPESVASTVVLTRLKGVQQRLSASKIVAARGRNAGPRVVWIGTDISIWAPIQHKRSQRGHRDYIVHSIRKGASWHHRPRCRFLLITDGRLIVYLQVGYHSKIAAFTSLLQQLTSNNR